MCCCAMSTIRTSRVAGNIVAWWQDGGRFVGYWFGQRFSGRGVGTAALRQFLQREQVRPLYAALSLATTANRVPIRKSGAQSMRPKSYPAMSSAQVAGPLQAGPSSSEPLGAPSVPYANCATVLVFSSRSQELVSPSGRLEEEVIP